MLAIKLPEEIKNRLAELAAKTGRTKTYYVPEAILEHLDELEKKYLAVEHLEKVDKRWALDQIELMQKKETHATTKHN